MSQPTEEEISRIQEAQAARILRTTMTDIVIELQEDIMDRLVSRYRSGELSDEEMRGAIGELAGMKGLLEALDVKVRKSRQENTNG